MNKRYILILSLLCVVLTMSYACAAENASDVVGEKTDEVISADEGAEDISKANNEDVVESVCENNSLNSTGDVLTSADAGELLALTSDDVLNSTVEVKLSSSNSYKTPTKKQRTFNIGPFKTVLSTSQYKKLFKVSGIEDIFFEDDYNYYYVGEKYRGYGVSDLGLWHAIYVKTNKYIKVKVKIGNKYKIKKTRAYMHFTYGLGQCGIAYRYMVFLSHKYDNPGYDYAKVLGKSAKYFTKCKHNTNFAKLNKSKLASMNYVYRKYSVY